MPAKTVQVNEELYDVEEAAAYMHVSKSTVYQAADEKRISHLRIGGSGRRGKILFRREYLDAFMSKNTIVVEQ